VDEIGRKKGGACVVSKKEEIVCNTAAFIHANGYANTKLSDILKENAIGKGQFYHYFVSKQDLYRAVVDHIVLKMKKTLFTTIMDEQLPPKIKLRKMIDEIYNMQVEQDSMIGCPIGNLAIELRGKDAVFRERISGFFQEWEKKVTETLDEMKQMGDLNIDIDTFKQGRALVAMLEGAILRAKNDEDIQILVDVSDVIKREYRL
jgi:TetR/AcrR family transcriptional repressor of nem operon